MGAAISKRGAYNLQKREKKSKKGGKLEERAASFICLSQAQIYEDEIKTPMPELAKHQSLQNIFDNHCVANTNANKEPEVVSSKSSSNHDDDLNPHDEKIHGNVLESESDYEEQVERKNSNIISLVHGESEINQWEPQEIKKNRSSKSSSATSKNSDSCDSFERWKDFLTDQYWMTKTEDTQNKEEEFDQKSDEQIEVDEQKLTEEQVLVVEVVNHQLLNANEFQVIDDQVIHNTSPNINKQREDQTLDTTEVVQNETHNINKLYQEQVEVTISEMNEDQNTKNKDEDYQEIKVKNQTLPESTIPFSNENSSDKNVQDTEDKFINAHSNHEIQKIVEETSKVQNDSQNVTLDAKNSITNAEVSQNYQEDDNYYEQILQIIENQEIVSEHNKINSNYTNLSQQEEQKPPKKTVTFEESDESKSSNIQELESEDNTTSDSDESLNSSIKQNQDIEEPHKDQKTQITIFNVNENPKVLTNDNDLCKPETNSLNFKFSPKEQNSWENEEEQLPETSTETPETTIHETIDSPNHNTDESNFWEQIEVLDEQVEVLNENLPSQQKLNDTSHLEKQVQTAKDTSGHKPLYKSVSNSSDMFYELSEESESEDQELFYDAETFDENLLSEQVETSDQLIATQTTTETHLVKNVNHDEKNTEIASQMSDDEKLLIIDKESKIKLVEKDQQNQDTSDGVSTDPKEEFIILPDNLIINNHKDFEYEFLDDQNFSCNDTTKTTNHEDLLSIFNHTQSDILNSSVLLDLNNDVSESPQSYANNTNQKFLPKLEETQNDHSKKIELTEEKSCYNKTDDLHPQVMLIELKEDQSHNPIKSQEPFTDENDDIKTKLFKEELSFLEQTVSSPESIQNDDSLSEATNEQSSSAILETSAFYTQNDMLIDLSQLNYIQEPQNKSPEKNPQELPTKTIPKPNNLPLPTNTQNASPNQEPEFNLDVFEKSNSITTPEEVAEDQMKIWGQQKNESVEEVILEINAVSADIHNLNAEIDKLGSSEKDKEIQTEMYQMLIKIMRDVNKINNHDFNEKIIELQHRALNEVHECLRKLQTIASG